MRISSMVSGGQNSAEAITGSKPYPSHFWALGLVGARPAEQKKGADRSTDGKLIPPLRCAPAIRKNTDKQEVE